MIAMAGTFIVQGQRVALPDATGAMLGFQRAPDIENSTPFGSSGGDGGIVTGIQHTSTEGRVCSILEQRAKQYGPLDPSPQVRAALIAKCEAEQRARPAGVRADAPVESGGGMDRNTKIAIGVGALLVAAIVVKKMKKR